MEAKAYLTFVLGNEKFAISVDRVQEVVEFEKVTKVPNAPDYMLGIINLRGRLLPLLDTKMKLGLPKTEITRKSRIMVLLIPGIDEKQMEIGALVDLAREVVEIREDETQAAPEFENYSTNAPISRILNKQGEVTMLMDIEKVFSSQDLTL
ncbi:chemotaxis protein CheW [Xanthocytophaga agilis]|uniref:Chemotaxis protein CheW n=1 Tax=Xanthocytophaga agilis TaxID=3048010 RepID=A0AAE3R1B9_9BACT|nr:chemotaxis protein CheW [Xanthocytophaga agilis]MDJ1499630.1 chemotaxis protein CheW [Xanthocytophaga agilis]